MHAERPGLSRASEADARRLGATNTWRRGVALALETSGVTPAEPFDLAKINVIHA